MLPSILQFAMQWSPLLLVTAVAGVRDDPGPKAADDRGAVARQVRIEQRMTIRIVARPSAVTFDPMFAEPANISRPRIRERKMGKCIGNAMIGGVAMRSESQLLLILRDQRLVSATLERSCRARDFYSGFYLARSADGKLCVDRDTLLARTGANCKLKQIRELVDAGR